MQRTTVFSYLFSRQGQLCRIFNLKIVKMKPILFLLFGVLTVPLEAQVTTQTGQVVQFRMEKIFLPEFGLKEMKFAEIKTSKGIQLLLLSGDCPLKKGDTIMILEGWEVPKYVLVNGSGSRWYCYMEKYLKRNRP